MFRLLLSKIFILESPLGISTNISLNSFIKGGKTSINIVKTKNEITAITKNSDNNLGIFKKFVTWLLILQMMLDITKEQIINKRKSLNVHIIKELIKITTNLKYDELLNWRNFIYFFSEYPNPFDFA